MPGFAILEGTTICVDKFRPSSEATHYFCTHAHADHTDGLSSSWNFSLIYCTEATAKILSYKFGLPWERFFILPFHERIHLKISPHRRPLPPPSSRDLQFSVTCFPANHCFGACMFLFEGYFGRFLYTGDFRGHSSLFHPDLQNVDRLYFDNTYLNTSCDSFYSLKEGVDEICKLMDRYDGYNTAIGLDYIGKEEILIELAQQLQRLISIDPDRYKLLESLIGNVHQFFTTDSSLTDIHVYSKRHLTLEKLDSFNDEIPTFGIVMTGWKKKTLVSEQGSRIHFVGYSIHSARQELRAFVKHVRPARVIPMLSCPSDVIKEQLGSFIGHREPKAFNMPFQIKELLRSKSLKRSTRKQPQLPDIKALCRKRKRVAFRTLKMSPKRKRRMRQVYRFSPSGRAAERIIRTLEEKPKIEAGSVIDLTVLDEPKQPRKVFEVIDLT